MLGIGAALLGSSHVIGVDIDSDALETAQGNLEGFEDLQASRHHHSLSGAPAHSLHVVSCTILYVGANYVAGRNIRSQVS